MASTLGLLAVRLQVQIQLLEVRLLKAMRFIVRRDGLYLRLNFPTNNPKYYSIKKRKILEYCTKHKSDKNRLNNNHAVAVLVGCGRPSRISDELVATETCPAGTMCLFSYKRHPPTSYPDESRNQASGVTNHPSGYAV